MQLTTKQVNSILGIEDSYKAPGKLMEILLDKEKRKDVFDQFVAINSNLDQDCFFQYFQDEHAERKKYAQDFTPTDIGQLIVRMLNGDNESSTTLDAASGTGGLTIDKWCRDRRQPDYRPSNYFYQCEELSDRAVPFLLFNLAIRGVNAVVVHCDVLTRSAKQVYFIQNVKDKTDQYSDINVMPRSRAVEKTFDIRKWEGEPIIHIETSLEDFFEEEVN